MRNLHKLIQIENLTLMTELVSCLKKCPICSSNQRKT